MGRLKCATAQLNDSFYLYIKLKKLTKNMLQLFEDFTGVQGLIRGFVILL